MESDLLKILTFSLLSGVSFSEMGKRLILKLTKVRAFVLSIFAKKKFVLLCF